MTRLLTWLWITVFTHKPFQSLKSTVFYPRGWVRIEGGWREDRGRIEGSWKEDRGRMDPSKNHFGFLLFVKIVYKL
jgi:hypothetical protein